MAATEKLDARIRELVDEALAETMQTQDARETAAAAIMAKLQPAFGAAAQRRRLICELRAAYKEGYLSGRSAGRFARWHGAIWSQSQIALRMRKPTVAGAEADTRFARYNFD